MRLPTPLPITWPAAGPIRPSGREPQLAAALAARGKGAGIGLTAVVADCAYWVRDDWYLALREAGLPTWWRSSRVTVSGPRRPPAHPIEAAHTLAWQNATIPATGRPFQRHFRDGRTETWWAADARLGGYGPNSPCRLIVATTDPARLLEKATWSGHQPAP